MAWGVAANQPEEELEWTPAPEAATVILADEAMTRSATDAQPLSNAAWETRDASFWTPPTMHPHVHQTLSSQSATLCSEGCAERLTCPRPRRSQEAITTVVPSGLQANRNCIAM
jgi:hypothetical protein